MIRVIISTAFDRLSILGEKQFTKNLELLDSNNIIGFSNIKKEFTTDYKECSILLIRDDKDYDELNEALKIKKATDFFLHHTNSNGFSKNQDKLFDKSHIKKGAHELNDYDIYYPLFTKIIFNDKIENKVEAIITEVFKSILDATEERVKADFLKGIWDGKKPQEIECPNVVAQINGISELLSYFNEKPYQEELDRKGVSPESEEQKFRLKLLREAILKSK